MHGTSRQRSTSCTNNHLRYLSCRKTIFILQTIYYTVEGFVANLIIVSKVFSRSPKRIRHKLIQRRIISITCTRAAPLFSLASPQRNSHGISFYILQRQSLFQALYPLANKSQGLTDCLLCLLLVTLLISLMGRIKCVKLPCNPNMSHSARTVLQQMTSLWLTYSRSVA